MQKEDKHLQQNTTDASSSKKYLFDFENLTWSSQENAKWDMSKNAWHKIENERKNIENDLRLLEAFEKEKSRATDIMESLFQIKEELEKKLKSNCE